LFHSSDESLSLCRLYAELALSDLNARHQIALASSCLPFGGGSVDDLLVSISSDANKGGKSGSMSMSIDVLSLESSSSVDAAEALPIPPVTIHAAHLDRLLILLRLLSVAPSATSNSPASSSSSSSAGLAGRDEESKQLMSRLESVKHLLTTQGYAAQEFSSCVH
jgi:hypothetical protein